ncbi:MAG: sigma-54 dependent transcriptional regulator [Rhodospirillales bacterium]|nr:sigma-54 dependent transcriptional regulator [Rhodospirillales bacterium]
MQLLIIGTLGGQIGAASKIAIARGAKVVQADDIEGGLEALRSGRGGDLVMVDVSLNVRQLIDALKAERINTPVVACGVQSDTQAAVSAIKAGAKEYLPLPPDAELIGAVLAAISDESHKLIYKDPAMADVVRMAEQVAGSDASILITGESGTGKEIIARHVHRNSKRKDKTFIAINCAAIPENLLESELFGHEKGAFTGAVAKRLGKFEEANGGTILLDEISEMDIRLQAKLLRVIQEREVDRIGGSKPVKVDVRIVATSNRDLQSEVQKGHFREDLYFRLNVVNLMLPSLRQRPMDLEVLSAHFIRKYAEHNDVQALPITPEAMVKIKSYGWPGNVRELENAMHRAVLMGGPECIDERAIIINTNPAVQVEPTPPPQQPAPMPNQMASGYGASGAATGGAASKMVGRTVAEVEQELIIDTLQHCIGNRTHAANILGISIRTLRNKLKTYSEQGVPVPAPGDSGGTGAL